jgi:HPt (histidine-containing phosphotransfer) domain-containing protein
LLTALRTALAEGAPSDVKSAAHALKGAIDNFGSTPAYELAQRLEKSGRDGNLVGAQDVWAALEKEVNGLNVALADFVSAESRE